MEIDENQHDCQILCLKDLADGLQETTRTSIKHSIRRYLGPRKVRVLERNMNKLIDWFTKQRARGNQQLNPAMNTSNTTFVSGDLVRIRDLVEIEITLDHFRRHKGCGFTNEMAQYCGTTQRVLKPVERFVDERELRIVRTQGIVILEGLTCQGMGNFGRCDRSCFYFWRSEWLEKIE